ncbi:hypothetical protein C4D60_Mb08t11090 [Musa balbisiana]|uniref:Uncharacterized protein n=1 Tax=Musa balbisiana TaxID=52838 RepID=A0A4S8K2W9_MUSBA|nr:hypothetical protein C4D60_Mb08t11090 [Musa balbisiana]
MRLQQCLRDSCQRCSELKLGVERVDYNSISGNEVAAGALLLLRLHCGRRRGRRLGGGVDDVCGCAKAEAGAGM